MEGLLYMQKVTTRMVPNAILSNQRFLDTIDHYYYYLIEQDYSQGTIDIRKTVFRKFLGFIQQSGLKKFNEIHRGTITKFIPYVSQSYQASSMGTVFSSMRSFLGFLYEKKLIT